jgi:hypothetical protein
MMNYSFPIWVVILLKSFQDKKLTYVHHMLLENTNSMITLNPTTNDSPHDQFLTSKF